MGAEVRLGSGRGGIDSIQVLRIKYCDPNCAFNLGGNGRFRCLHHNGDAIIQVTGGISSREIGGTVDEFSQQAPCVLGHR